MRWTQEGHKNVSFRTSVEKSTLTQTTSVTVTSEFDHSQLITLVCKAEDALHLLEKNESIILIHRKDEEILDEVVFVSFEQYSKLTLNCSYTDVRVLVWEKKHIDGSLETLAVIHGLNNFSKIYHDSLSLNEEGALVVSKVDIHHEGTYRCTFIDDNKEAVKSYKVAVYGMKVLNVVNRLYILAILPHFLVTISMQNSLYLNMSSILVGSVQQYDIAGYEIVHITFIAVPTRK